MKKCLIFLVVMFSSLSVLSEQSVNVNQIKNFTNEVNKVIGVNSGIISNIIDISNLTIRVTGLEASTGLWNSVSDKVDKSDPKYIRTVTNAVNTNTPAGTVTINGNTLVIGTQQTGGGSTNVYTAGMYPVLKLEMGAGWTDFELKASTDNFATLVYYYVSSTVNAVADDADPYVFFSDDYAADVRKWIKQYPVHSPILNQLTDMDNSTCDFIYIMPSTNTMIPASTWMYQTNNHLVWSYVRFDGVGFEKNATGTKTKWQLVQPERWDINRIEP